MALVIWHLCSDAAFIPVVRTKSAFTSVRLVILLLATKNMVSSPLDQRFPFHLELCFMLKS
jgi:hypothetical protein